MSAELQLNDDCRAMLSGDQGPDLQFAMQLVERDRGEVKWKRQRR